jgi:N6-adenosine-specific RNA methylase IME4
MALPIIIDPEFQALIPPLRPDERAQLEANIKLEGVRDPLVVWAEQDILLDGHNRHAIATALGLPFDVRRLSFASRDDAILWVVNNQFGRRNLTTAARAELAMRIEPILATQAKARQAAAGGDKISQKALHLTSDEAVQRDARSRNAALTSSQAAEAAGLKRDTYHKAKTILTTAPAPIVEAFKAGELSTNQAYQQVRREQKEQAREQRRQENRDKIANAPEPAALAVDVKYATIVIDPPWDWGDEGDGDQLGRARPDYATMSIDQLAALDVGALADDDCHLYLWITNRSLPKGFRLIEQWGFRYVTALTWVKPHFGMGNYFRGQTEHVLFAVKGSQPLLRKDMGTVFHAPRGPLGHSSKPEMFLPLVESCSPGPYLEMFSRSERDGWVAWGENAHA